MRCTNCKNTKDDNMVDESAKLNGLTKEHFAAVEPGQKIRDKWGRRLDFFIACVGFGVGLGNVWRFPYLCYKNGGGAFLLPYLMCVVIGGVPLFYLEVSLGQMFSVSGPKLWNLCPIFKGIGLATFVVVVTSSCYYNIVIAWAFYYMFASFNSLLPWSHCNNTWNSINCTTLFALNSSNTSIEQDSVTEFWQRKVLGLSSSIDIPGTPKWDIALCLLLAWILVYVCICKGIRSSSKVMYVTALAPYILLTAMLIRGATLPGAKSGVLYFLRPDFRKLADLQVWVDAGTQVIYSFAISLGALIALGSYNKFHHNSYRDALTFGFTNSGTSLFAGFVIFCVLGHMSHERNLPIDKVAEKGPGLAFLVYPRALMEMAGAPAWAAVFFFTIILIGIDSQFLQVESVVACLADQWPERIRRGYRQEILTAVVCALMYLVGLTMCTNGGMYVFQLFDYYGVSKMILLIALCHCVAVAWIYGIKNYYRELEYMLGFTISRYMYICWLALSPIFCAVMFIMSMVVYSELTYDLGNYIYIFPQWAVAIGWIMAFSSIIFVPVVALYQVIKRKNSKISVWQAMKKACEPIQNDSRNVDEVEKCKIPNDKTELPLIKM